MSREYLLLTAFGLQNVRTQTVQYVQTQVKQAEQQVKSYNLPYSNEVVNTAKGYLPPELQPKADVTATKYILPENDLGDYPTTDWGKSYLGTLVFSPFEFLAGNYEKGNELIKYEGLRIDTALIDVALEKQIVRTAIQGRKGTVKEFISDGDYLITVRALLVSPNTSLSPESAIRRLNTLFTVPDSLAVKSDFLQLFSVYRIVVDKPTFKQVQSFPNMIAVEFTAYSDNDLESAVNKELDRPTGA